MILLIFSSGLVCLPIAGERLDQLQIPLMVPKNTEPHRTAFTVSVDYKEGKTPAPFVSVSLMK
jgi:3,4-dihydroxy-2-butanone 4-phosphate synthase